MALLERLVVRPAKPLKSVAEIPPGTRYVPERPLTVDEFYALIDEDSPAELDEGAIVMPAPASLHHEDCFTFLIGVLRSYVDVRGLGIVLGSRFKTRLDLRVAREPDILFVARDRMYRVRDHEVDGAPDLVVEIINSDKARSEAMAKVPQFERAGTPELWLIDLPLGQVHQLLLRDSRFVETLLTRSDTLHAKAIPGFRLEVSVLFSQPGSYPSGWHLVQQLLQDPSGPQP